MASQQALASRIADIPESISVSLKKGFLALAGLPQKQRIELTDKIIEASLNGRTTVDLKEFMSGYDLDISQGRDAMNAISSFISLSSESPESIEQFLDITHEKLYAGDQKDIAREVLRLVLEKRDLLRRSLDLATVASETLPSFRALSLTVDLRPKFENNSIVDATPVSIVHLSTDTAQELWMQLTRSEIKFIQGILSAAADKMDATEQFFAKSLGQK